MASLRVGYCGRWQYGMLMDEAAGARQRRSGAEIHCMIDILFETDRWGRLNYCRRYRREVGWSLLAGEAGGKHGNVGQVAVGVGGRDSQCRDQGRSS